MQEPLISSATPDDAGGQVRVMTVHGSKGLQAPIVILADATGEPGTSGDLSLNDDPLGNAEEDARQVPLPSLSKDQSVGPVCAAKEKAEIAAMQEHWRLLYVAMTRAEEALFIGGSLGPRQAKKGAPHDDSWYARVEPVFEGPSLADPIWGARREWGARADPLETVDEKEVTSTRTQPPHWLTMPIGAEPKPPRPLAPSSAGEAQGAEPPLAPEQAGDAARRGILIHALLERLPDVEPTERGAGGKRLA